MTGSMVRKQIYLPKRQDQILKRLAKTRGVSEAEVIRQALDREVEAPLQVVDGEAALAKMATFAEKRGRKFAGQGEPFRWDRDALYEERESRYFKSGRGT